MMEGWSGVFKVPLCNNGAYYQVAASLCLTPSKTLQVPLANAIFFSGDRVRGTGNPVIEKLSNLQQIAEILVSKFGRSVNAWVIEASAFTLGFAVYKDFIPSVNQFGEPNSYIPNGFPASSSVLSLLSNCLVEVKNELVELRTDSAQATVTDVNSTRPKTILLGFSKGGIVLNQLITELAASTINSNPNPENISDTQVIPSSPENFLDTIAEIHYIDVGLNSPGAYLTDKDTLKKVSTRAKLGAQSIQFLIHGTPRQWNDKSRPWIQKEKDELVRLLEAESQASHGKLAVCERLYFGDRSPDLQMHFEIIDALDVSSGFFDSSPS